METQRRLSVFLQLHLLLPLLLLMMMILLMGTSVAGFGSVGPISAAYGQEDGFFCAIDASGKQEIICWKKNSSTSSTAAYFGSLPPMEALSGGEGFMCGILANTSLAYCWNSIDSGKNLVPLIYRRTTYSHIAAGKTHVCGVRGSYFSGTDDSGAVDCWEIITNSKSSSDYVYTSSLFSTSVHDLISRTIVSGDGFSCGARREGGIVCWGPKSSNLGVSEVSMKFVRLASGIDSLCGISGDSGEVKCWGEIGLSSDRPNGTRFFELAAGAHHYCGIKENDHGIECWGNYNTSSIPRGSGFLAISSSDFITCGIREDDLIIHCWGAQGPPPSDYKPPLQLCSPGLCMSGSCDEGKFSFNASILGVPGLTNLCVQPDLNICLPCGLNCSEGFFPSSECSKNADLVCTACSLCQNSFCSDVCGPLSSSFDSRHQQQYAIKKLIIIIGSSILGFTLILITFCILPRKSRTGEEEQREKQCTSCIGTSELEAEINVSPEHPLCVDPCLLKTRVFRLSELKDATNGFREYNELGRGSYGFVYKAILPDGQEVSVKRDNAAKIIHFAIDIKVPLETKSGIYTIFTRATSSENYQQDTMTAEEMQKSYIATVGTLN